MRAWVLAAAVVGCSGKTEQTPPVPSPSPSPSSIGEAIPEPPPVVPPDFPEGTRSLELRRTIGVRIEPGEAAKRIGTIAIDTRVAWVRTARYKGCERPWIEIRPRGWICGDFVEPSKKPPYGQEVPKLERGELVPGIYGKVTAPASVTYALEKPEKPKKPKKKAATPVRKADKRDLRAKPGTAGDKIDKRDKGDKTAQADKAARGTRPAADDATGKPARAEARQDLRPADRKRAAAEVPEAEDEVPAGPAAPPRMIEGRPLVGSINVRQYDEVTVGGRQYWKIDRKANEYVLKQAISQHRPSLFSGARLADDTGWSLPVAFVWPRFGARLVWTTTTAQGVGVIRQVLARTPLPILETALDKAGKPRAYRIGAAEWIAAAEVRLFQPAPPPPMLEPGERWIDVDVDDQILVAYEGDLPVYATLISSGSTATPTETGVYRMWLKESEADMNGLSGEDPYSVATVPWTQFFSPEKGLALHTAYWHDQFGTRRSHGCVNLAPRDARWLYFWSEPQVPPGWTMAAGLVEAPGSIVRVRSKDDPAPEARGYAKKVLELRQQNAPLK